MIWYVWGLPRSRPAFSGKSKIEGCTANSWRAESSQASWGKARLLDVKGQPLPVAPAMTDRDDGGQAVVVLDLILAPLGEGSYVLEFVGTAGTEQERELLAFKIVR